MEYTLSSIEFLVLVVICVICGIGATLLAKRPSETVVMPVQIKTKPVVSFQICSNQTMGTYVVIYRRGKRRDIYKNYFLTDLTPASRNRLGDVLGDLATSRGSVPGIHLDDRHTILTFNLRLY